MLQKEVAERIIAKPPQMSLLALSVQFYSQAELIANVGRDNFWPAPTVDSAIIRLDTNQSYFKKILEKKSRVLGNEKDFFRLLKFGFSAKRKMLKNNLAAGLQIPQDEIEKILIKHKFNPKARAQELSLDDWMVLYKNIILK